MLRPPPVLLVQLKRFKNVEGQWKKQHTLVDFPLENLDVAPYLMDWEFASKLNLSSKYDLCGIVNHFGSLTFGHYISVVRNPYEDKWYKYDDQNRIPIPADQISKQNAYILFYVRKDALEK
mmetsp:Transcript_16279/g.27518  ORF Transcript_16279/g.27518 Transcript_16279/m.27518 type:complete len:121 (+) Transcript_16279:279-641(+)